MVVDIANYENQYGLMNKLYRISFILVWGIFVRTLPRNIFKGWKRTVLRLFGAKIGRGVMIESGARIFLPYNLEMKDNSRIASGVTVHNLDMVTVGKEAVISQGAFICAGSHDIDNIDWHQITAPIVIGDYAWVAVNAFVGMGVSIGEGAVVGACSAVFRDVDEWTVVGGNPAKILRKRMIHESRKI